MQRWGGWLLGAAVVLGAACSRAPDDREDPTLGADAGTDTTLDDECREADDCPAFASCRSGVCDTRGRDCWGQQDCGAHFDCIEGRCYSRPPQECDLPCCDGRGCAILESCIGFRCEPAPCADDWECTILYGVTNIYGCRTFDDCPEGAECINFAWSECVYVADASCEESGRQVRLFGTTDGVGAPLCVEMGTCTDGRCEQ